ncbi:condensin-2 complex subunit D3 [Caerostris extrusa]|uniref:Condensin-2 complex subunit D3 n=1 Tax=Caerostris extrusa TaxID=172846 RepID=A0AAV4XI86_CAEEX|nr:condensin-2 complex subunit D3 [Caerostris extrusa]
MDNDILHITSEHFNNVNFRELDERWLDEVICNEFTDVEENNMSMGILFPGDYTTAVLDLCRVCEAWIPKASDVGNVSTEPNMTLWSYLKELDVSARQIQGVVYFLCAKALKKTSSNEDKEIGLLSAKWYFSCLRVPGSSAYAVSNSSLFQLCIDCLQIPDIDSQDAAFKWQDFEALLPIVNSTMESLLPLLNVYDFGSDLTVIKHIIHKLYQLAGSEFSNIPMNFELNFLNMPEKEQISRKYSQSYVLTSFAYQGLSSIINSDQYDEEEYILVAVLNSLNHYILCDKIKRSPIPTKFLNIKNNAVSFICYILDNNKDQSSEYVMKSLKYLCLNVNDKTDFRATVSQAILSITSHLLNQDVATFIGWLLELVDDTDMNNRIFTLEILGILLGNNATQVEKEGLPENLQVYLSPIPIVFSILTRCDDASPSVRSKALCVLSQYMKRILDVLTELKNPSNFHDEEYDEDEIGDNEVNGQHRSFWYNFSSFKDVIEEINYILQRRIEDNNFAARKASLQALENIICFDVAYLTAENLKLMLTYHDTNILMRKQMIQSLTLILETYPFHSKAQEYWIKGVFPLVYDTENTVQVKAFNVIEEKLLWDILSPSKDVRDAAFSLLEKLYKGELLSHQRYLQKAFNHWHAEQKLGPDMVSILERTFGFCKDEVIWFFLSKFGKVCKLPLNLCENVVEELKKLENWSRPTLIENLLNIFGYIFSDMHPENLQAMQGIFKQKLDNAFVPIETLPLMIELLYKTEKHLGRDENFTKIADKMMEDSIEILSPFISRKKTERVAIEDLAVKSLTTIKAFCQIYPAYITQNLTVLLKGFAFARQNKTELPLGLCAHAFLTLGVLCLQDEALGRELLPFFAKELSTSQKAVLRNAAVIILIDMCRRYTAYADTYLPLITTCFKDTVYAIRYQTVISVISLLQEDFIKCDKTLLYPLLFTITDKNEAIQDLGKYSLCNLIYAKNKSIFFENFINSIFVFNNFPPRDNGNIAGIVKENKQFALRGEEKKEMRMQIYKFMLHNIDPTVRVALINGMLKILSSIAESVYSLNHVTESVAQDCLGILSSKEIRAIDTEDVLCDVEESEEAPIINTELEIRKLTLVQPAIPVMISLKNRVFGTKKKSNTLLMSIIAFLTDILADFRNEVETLMAGDKMLKMQVLYDIQMEEAEARRKKEMQKKKKKVTKPTVPETTMSDFERSFQVAQFLMQKCRTPGTSAKNVSRRLRSAANRNDWNLPSTSGWKPSNPEGRILSSTPQTRSRSAKLNLPDISRISVALEEDDLDSD